MTTTSAASGGRGGDVAPAGGPSSDVLGRAAGVQLIGEMPGSGYREPPALVRRQDGQMLQLTQLLYAVVEAVHGRPTVDEVAAAVSASYGKVVTPANIRRLVEDQLRPMGLLLTADGSEPRVKKSRPLLGLQLRYTVTDPEKTRRLTAPFAVLFHPLVATVVVAAFVVVSWWLLLDKGLASAAHEAFHEPGLLLLIFAVTVLSAGFHEFGHAAAARRGGATPGAMGMGLYLFWPAFYTDVTDSYRLGRGGRLRTDLGGLYFNAIVAVAIVGVWWIAGYDALLLVVATQILQMLRQLLPTIRFDGYHVLADLTGVPDLYSRIKPILLSLLPWRWHDPRAAALKPWARGVITAWVVVVVPVFLFSVLLMVLTLPRLVATAWVSLREHGASMSEHTADGEVLDAVGQLLAVVALAVPVLGMTYLMVRLVRQLLRSTWRSTSGHPARRGLALLVAAAVAAGLGWAWWPRGDVYRPIAAYERGTLGAMLPRPAFDPSEPLTAGARGTIQTTWPEGEDRPTQDEPALAVVMVPTQGTGSPTSTALPQPSPTASESTTPSATASAAPTSPAPSSSSAPSAMPSGPPAAGVFPFDLPLPPADGDNQALAVNTTDDTVAYDVAFALVWVDDDTVTNTNEAFAAASCTGCAAVAVSFQVVFVMSDADVIVPQNLATAVNYDCLECLTYALASQLVITLDGPLGDSSLQALESLWQQMSSFAADITSVPLDELDDELNAFQQQIEEIILADPSASPGSAGSTGPSPGQSTAPSGEPSGPATDQPSQDPTPTPSSTTSSLPTPSVSDTPTETSSGSVTPTPTPSQSPSPSASPSSSALVTQASPVLWSGG